MEKTMLKKANSLLTNIRESVIDSIFGEREYENDETSQINSEEDILKLMNGDNSHNKEDEKISSILLSGLKEADKYRDILQGEPSKKDKEFKISKKDEKANIATKSKSNADKTMPEQRKQKDDKEIGKE